LTSRYGDKSAPVLLRVIVVLNAHRAAWVELSPSRGH
jgi:hypothetical protein